MNAFYDGFRGFIILSKRYDLLPVETSVAEQYIR